MHHYQHFRRRNDVSIHVLGDSLFGFGALQERWFGFPSILMVSWLNVWGLQGNLLLVAPIVQESGSGRGKRQHWGAS